MCRTQNRLLIARILCKLRSHVGRGIVPPTLVNIFGGGNGNTDIDDAAEEICSRWGPNRDAMTGDCCI